MNRTLRRMKMALLVLGLCLMASCFKRPEFSPPPAEKDPLVEMPYEFRSAFSDLYIDQPISNVYAVNYADNTYYFNYDEESEWVFQNVNKYIYQDNFYKIAREVYNYICPDTLKPADEALKSNHFVFTINHPTKWVRPFDISYSLFQLAN